MNIALLGSDGHCGIYEYSQILKAGFEELGHSVRYLGVPHGNSQRLWEAVRSVGPDNQLVIVEYEPGIFRLRPLIAVIAYLRFVRAVPVLLSVHEIEASKYPEYHHIQRRLSQGVRFGGLLEYPHLVFLAADVLLRYFALRAALALLGQLVSRIAVHSPKAREQIGLITSRPATTVDIPQAIRPQDGSVAELRDALGLPVDRFVFITPGFIFRRKRIVEVMDQLTSDVTLLIVGTPSAYEPDYIQEVRDHIAAMRQRDIRLIEDYERMEDYLLASDAVVLYYRDGFQSGVATLALGAGKPCIFADLPAFAIYREAGLTVTSDLVLRHAMQVIRDPGVYDKLERGAMHLREEFSPSRVAALYLAAAERAG